MKKGWQAKKLGEVSEIVCGGTPDTKVSEYWDGEYLWIAPKDMGKLESPYVDDEELFCKNVTTKFDNSFDKSTYRAFGN